jgi:hypothetical protein
VENQEMHQAELENLQVAAEEIILRVDQKNKTKRGGFSSPFNKELLPN